MKKTKVVIATGLFPPDVGGAATHAQALHTVLQKEGIITSVVSFSRVRHLPPLVRHVVYTLIFFHNLIGARTVCALDELSVGFPAALLSMLMRKKLILRIGGDRLWEKAVQEELYDKPLPAFCEEQKAKKIYPLSFFLVRWVLHRAQYIVFPSAWYRDLAVRTYSLQKEKTMVIENTALHEMSVEPAPLHKSPRFIYAGRFSKVKNLPLLLAAFSSVLDTHPAARLILYGSGPEEQVLRRIHATFPPQAQEAIRIEKPLPRKILLEEIKKSYACVLPSLSEVSPNFALECDAVSVPTLLTEYTGEHQYLSHAYFIDPQREVSVAQGISELLDAQKYELLLAQRRSVKKETESFSKKWITLLT